MLQLQKTYSYHISTGKHKLCGKNRTSQKDLKLDKSHLMANLIKLKVIKMLQDRHTVLFKALQTIIVWWPCFMGHNFNDFLY